MIKSKHVSVFENLIMENVMKKIIGTISLVLLSYSGLTQAGGNPGWDQNKVEARTCVVGTNSEYRFSTEARCMDGITQGKVKGIKLEGWATMPDWSKRPFSGILSPGNEIPFTWDSSKGEQPRGVTHHSEWIN